MIVTVHCGCGSPYEFEVEPVGGAMPHAVQCPHCGADGTEFANAVIANELAAAAPAAPSAPRFCKKHGGEPIINECFVCKKPLCLQCMAQYGYLCSLACQRKAEERRLEVPVYELQESVIQERVWRRAKRLGAAVVLLAVVWIGIWAWYRFHASRPRVFYSVSIPEKERVSQCRFLDTETFLLLRPKKLVVYSLRKTEPLWTHDLSPYFKNPYAEPAAADAEEGASPPAEGEEAAAPAGGDAEDEAKAKALDRELRKQWAEEYAPNVHLHTTATDIWLVFPTQAIRIDRGTGAEKGKLPFEGDLQDVAATDVTLEIFSTLRDGRERLMQIDLKSGEAQTETKDPPPAPVYVGQREVSMEAVMAGADASSYSRGMLSDQRKLIPTGPNVAQLDIHLVKENVVAYDAMKEKKGSAFDEANTSVLDTKKVAEEILGDMKRSLGQTQRHEDESIYEVTIRRLFADPNEWKGEVVGAPAFFPMKTVDLLVADKSLRVFDKSNTLLWEAKLSFPIAKMDRFADSETETLSEPGLERGDALYFCDRGVLTAFEKATGKVRWRIPSVGISRIQLDDRDMLYINTTTADPEMIRFSEQVDMDKMGKPILLKVNAKNGKKVWVLSNPGDRCLLSGRFVFLTTAGTSKWEVLGSVLHGGGGNAPVHFRMHRLNPKTGRELWEYHVKKAPEHVDIRENRVLLQYPNEIQVLKFLAF